MNILFRKISLGILILFIFSSYCYSENEKKFLNNFFDGDEYQIQHVLICGNDMNLAVKYKDSSQFIVEKAIIYQLEKNTIIPHIKFTKDKIEIKNEAVFSSNIKGKDFYGWKIKITEKSGFIRTTYYCENGKNIADGISLFWDKNRNTFIKYEIDRSQW